MNKRIKVVNDWLKTLMPFMIFVAILLGLFNLIFLYRIQSKLNQVENKVVQVDGNLNTMTSDYKSIVDYRQRNRSHKRLQDIIIRIDQAENDITEKLDQFYYRY